MLWLITGAWFVEKLALDHQQSLRTEAKFKGLHTRITIDNKECHLLIPITYMNLSGEAVYAFTKFYKISPENILIAYDELDYAPGIVRLKENGGHGGHNGLHSVIQHLNTRDFLRLRIGIGHPRNSSQPQDVVNYVLHKPSHSEQQLILKSIDSASNLLSYLVSGNIQQAMKELHS